MTGVPSAESSRSVRGLGKGASCKPYPRLCNARRPRLEPGTFRSQAGKTLPLAPGPPFEPFVKHFQFIFLDRFYLQIVHVELEIGEARCGQPVRLLET